MAFKRFDYVPSDGIKNELVFPDTPISSQAAREQFQRLYDQARDAVNELQESLEASNGAEHIGSHVDGMDEKNVGSQIAKLKAVCDILSTGVTPPDYITDNMLHADNKVGSLSSLVTEEKGSVTDAINDLAENTVYRPAVIRESGNYVAPATGLYKVTVVGGGAGGSYALRNDSSNDSAAPGGASGGTAIKWIRLTKGQVVPVSVGKGGAGALYTSAISSSEWVPGESGGTSSFGEYCSATGGAAIARSMYIESFYLSGIPGNGYDGNINISGHRAPLAPPRRYSSQYAISCGNPGADSYMGAGGYFHYHVSSLPNGIIALSGIDATGFGAGGGGSFVVKGGDTECHAGNGSDGVVIVEYFGYGSKED